MNYWIFKCNPEHYRLSDRLADPEPQLTWLVKRYQSEVAPGDIIFVWETGEERGIRAILEATSSPCKMPEMESEQQYKLMGRDDEIHCRVLAKITNRSVSLHSADLRKTPGLEELSVFHGDQRRTNFRVTAAEGGILMSLV